MKTASRAGTVLVALASVAFVSGCGLTRLTGTSQDGDPSRDAPAASPDAAAPSRPDDANVVIRPDGDAGRTTTADAARDGVDQDARTAQDAATPHAVDACGRPRPDVFADAVVSFTPGPSAGFGAKNMPCVVLGPPIGTGASGGSTDVVSLGNGGSIVVEFQDVRLSDGPGVDLLVFENAFPGWTEPAFVAVSDDGTTWSEWPCEPENAADGYPHCAGVAPTFSNPTNGIDPSDAAAAGGDGFDLGELGVTSAKFVRIRDGGSGKYSGTSGGFDLDAVAGVHADPVPGR
jgi:hypothetical protein